MENDVIKKDEKENGMISEPVSVDGSNIENINTDAQTYEEIVTSVDSMKIENGKNRMKIKCVKCKLEDTLTEEDIKLLAHVVKRYNQKPSPNDYTAVMSIIKGNCTDGKKHLFVFDETFDKTVADMLKEYKDAIVANVVRKETLEKVCLQIAETINQIKSLQSSLGELEKKKEYTTAEMRAGGILVNNIKLKFMNTTGTDDTDMWS